MPELSSKSPRTNYATRSAEDKPNIAYPDGAPPVEGEEARASVELADQEVLDSQSHRVTLDIVVDTDATIAALTLDLTTLDSDLDTAIAGAVTDAGEETAAKAAVHAIVTDAALAAILTDDGAGAEAEANASASFVDADVAEDATVTVSGGSGYGALHTADVTDLLALTDAAIEAEVTTSEVAATQAAVAGVLDEAAVQATVDDTDYEDVASDNASVVTEVSVAAVTFATER